MLTVIVLYLLAQGFAQNFLGGTLDSLYTSSITIGPNSQNSGNYSFSEPLEISTFEDGEQFHIGTSIQDFSFYFEESANPSQNYYFYFEVAVVRLSSNLKNFQFQVRTLRNPNFNVLDMKIKRVKLNFIIVGSNFPGFYNEDLPDSFIFARNSEIVQPVLNSHTLVDFKNQFNQSPFKYDPSLPKYFGCGAVKKDGNWILETKLCKKITATLYFTGVYKSLIRQNVYYRSFFMQFKDINSNSLKGQIDLLSLMAKFSTNQDQDGVSLFIETQNIKFVQISIVVVALRQYQLAVYPLQGVFIDSFSVNSFITSRLTFQNDNLDINLDAVPLFSQLNKDQAWSPHQFGHRFCGLSGLRFQIQNSVNKATIGFYTDLSEPNPVLRGMASTSRLIVSFYQNKTKSLFHSENYLLFVSTNSCRQKKSIVYFNLPNNTVTPGSFGSVIYSDIPNKFYQESRDPHLLSPVNIFATNIIQQVPLQFIHYLSPVTILKVGVYEGVISFSTLITSQRVKFTIILQTKEQQLFFAQSKVENLDYFHFAFQVLKPCDSILIKIKYENTTNFNPFRHVIQFIIFEHQKIKDDNMDCVDVCPVRQGYQTGIDYRSIPPKCIDCNLKLNQYFNDETGKCECAPTYTIDFNGFCRPCMANLCKTCQINQNESCGSCVRNAIWKDFSNIAKGCQCNKGYYQEGRLCSACPSACQECLSKTKCLTCFENNNTRNGPEKNCACRDDFYESSLSQCLTCTYPCATCEGLGTTCTSCIIEKNLILRENSCVCQTGFFLVNSKCFEKPVNVLSQQQMPVGIAIAILISCIVAVGILVFIVYRYKKSREIKEQGQKSGIKQSIQSNSVVKRPKMVLDEKQPNLESGVRLAQIEQIARNQK